MSVKEIAILGCTGSIGVNTLDVVRRFPGRFRVRGLACGENVGLLAEQVRQFSPDVVSVKDGKAAAEMKKLMGGARVKVLHGVEGMVEVASARGVEMVVSAIVGSAGLVPTMAAIESGKDIALANKETLVCAGPLVMDAVRRKGVKLLPVDSEHSAIFQSMKGHRQSDLLRITLTASGGPFQGRTKEELGKVKPKDALKHPNWEMGRKITIDSATLMNKGLEVIEAKWLFGVGLDKINVLVHPQSIIHSMVEFVDGSVIAQNSGTTSFYLTWIKLSLFAGGVSTNIGSPEWRRTVGDLGSQLDIRMTLLSHLRFTLSLGYARALEQGMLPDHEFMVSLKIL